MKTEYARVTFRARTRMGRVAGDSIGAKPDVSLTRVTEDGRDDLVVGMKGSTWEVPWTHVASAEPVGVLGRADIALKAPPKTRARKAAAS